MTTNKILKWIGWFLLCAILQSTLVPHIAIFSIKPDLMVLLLFLLVIKTGVMTGVYVGFFVGLGQDVFSPSLLGQNALAMTITGFVCGHFNERVMRLDVIMRAALLVAAFIIHDSVIMAVHIIKTEGTFGILFSELFLVTLPRALYTLVFAVAPFIWVSIVKPQRLVD